MKIDLLDANVHLVELSVTQARRLIDEWDMSRDDIATALDEAQGDVFSDSRDVAYVVIKITQ